MIIFSQRIFSDEGHMKCVDHVYLLLAQGEVPLFGSEKCRETCPEACDALGVDISRVEAPENVVGG